MPLSSMFIKSPAQPRKHARSLSRIALALATLATAGLFNAAHATFPGENGAIVFDFSESPSNSSKIGKVSPGNSAVTTLASGKLPSVSPNGKKVAFQGLNGASLYVMNIDGSNVVQVYDGTADQVTVGAPAWLPDGSKVAYVRIRSTPSESRELWATNPDGTGSTFMRDFVWGDFYNTMAASPWGYSYTFSQANTIYLSTELSPGINNISSTGKDPSWAPDGKSILIHSAPKQWEIHPDGSRGPDIPVNGVSYGASAISPDGEFIAGTIYPGSSSSNLDIRTRTGTPTTFSWPGIKTPKTDWSRVPKNCYASTPQGGGGVLAGDVNFYASQCAIAVMPNGGGLNGILQQAIAVGPDQRLYHRSLISSPFGGDPIWTGFTPVPGGGGNPNGINAKKIAIAAAKDGSAQVVIINANDNLVYHAMRYANGTWSGFNPLDGAGGAPNFAARDVAITINASTPTSPGTAQVIANGLSAGGLYHRARYANGSWSSFQPISDGNVFKTHEIAIAAGEDGGTNILASVTQPDGSQARIMQLLAYGTWGSWLTVGIPPGATISASSDVAVTRTLSGTAQLMFTDSAGNAFYQERTNPNVPSSWQSPVSTPQIANTVGRAVSISAGASAGSSSQLLLTRTFPQ